MQLGNLVDDIDRDVGLLICYCVRQLQLSGLPTYEQYGSGGRLANAIRDLYGDECLAETALIGA